MKTILTLIFVALALTGCASSDYALYADGQARAETARHNADAAKYKAMADIAASGAESAKVAAVMAIALGQQEGAGQGLRLQAPQQSSALQWAQVLVPGLTQIAGIAANVQMATTQSNNAARVAESTNSAFVGIAGQIQAPATPQANISTVTTSTDSHAQTLAGTGTLGSGAYNTADSHDVSAPVVVPPVVQVVPVIAGGQ